MRGSLVIAICLAVLVISGSPARAVTPVDLRIEHSATPLSGSFVMSGAFADSGSVTRDGAKFSAVPSPTVGAGQFFYTFVGTAGTLSLRLQWLLTATDEPTIGRIDGHWVVTGGTGVYAGLLGEGDYVARIDFAAQRREAVFTGQVH